MSEIEQRPNGEGVERSFPSAEVFGFLRRQLRRLVGDAHAVEDLVQETLLRAIRHHDRLRDRHARDGWLLRIAYHVAMDWHRRRSRLHQGLEEENGTPPVEIAAPREDVALVRDESLRWSQRLRRALATLGPRDRGLVLGHYYVGFSCRQLAERSGLSESNVKVRLHRARRWLRRVLPELPGAEGSSVAAPGTDEMAGSAGAAARQRTEQEARVPEPRAVVELSLTRPSLRYAPSVRRKPLPERGSESA